MSNPAVPFPTIGKPSEFVKEGSVLTEISHSSAEIASEEEIHKEKEGWGYTNPNLHRRIVIPELRDSAIGTSNDAFTFYSDETNISKGQTLTLEVQPEALTTVKSCTYDSQRLTNGVDYSVQYSETPGIIYISLLAGSSIIPSVSGPDKRLIVNFRKFYPNDYTLQIQGMNSYRTTVVVTHDEDEAVQTSRPEIP